MSSSQHREFCRIEDTLSAAERTLFHGLFAHWVAYHVPPTVFHAAIKAARKSAQRTPENKGDNP